MTPRPPGLGTTTSAVLPISTALLAAAIFVVDLLTPAETPMGALYAVVVLMASRFYRAHGIIVVAAACAGLVLLNDLLTPLLVSAPGNETTERINDAVGIAVIGLTSVLVLQGQAAETALRDSEKQWREVFDHNPTMYFMVDPAGTILSVNAFGAEQLGYTVGELEAQSSFKLFLGSDREIAQRNVALCVENHGQSYSWEARKSRKDGSVLWVRENAKAVRRSGDKRSPIQTGPVNINELILEVIALTRGEVDRNRVALRTQLADGLPSIQGDRIQLQQVILNLVMNAIEAVSGGEPRELRIASTKDESQNVVVSVGDSGPGLDPASVNHIFDTFYSTKSDGMGMGLAISRSIVESHGGQLWASANVPRGAVFQFALPAEQIDVQAPLDAA